MHRSFKGYSEEIQRLATQQPDGWEYLLTAALMKDCLRTPVRRYEKVLSGVAVRERRCLDTAGVFAWFAIKMKEARDIARSLHLLYSKELQQAWGEPGIPGDPIEILDAIESLAATAERAVDWELDVKFTNGPEIFDGLFDALSGAVGPNLVKFLESADILDEGVRAALANPDTPHEIRHTIFLDLPEGWNERIESELELVREHLGIDYSTEG